MHWNLPPMCRWRYSRHTELLHLSCPKTGFYSYWGEAAKLGTDESPVLCTWPSGMASLVGSHDNFTRIHRNKEWSLKYVCMSTKPDDKTIYTFHCLCVWFLMCISWFYLRSTIEQPRFSRRSRAASWIMEKSIAKSKKKTRTCHDICVKIRNCGSWRGHSELFWRKSWHTHMIV
jgi:hypothetical protein